MMIQTMNIRENEHQLMASYGWETIKQAALYAKKANREKLAGDAMHLLALGQRANEKVQDSSVPQSGWASGIKVRIISDGFR